jgi:predicted RNase H-like HicB family nuclease
MKKLILTGEIWQEGNMYTSYCPELDVASCGHTIEEAKKNLLEVIDIFIEETLEMGTLREIIAGTDLTVAC